MFRATLDNNPINFCSNDHVRLGTDRWNEKKKMGVRPGVPSTTSIDENEAVGDNIMDIEGGDE